MHRSFRCAAAALETAVLPQPCGFICATNVLGRSRNHVAAGSPRKSPIAASNMIRRDMALYPTIHILKYRSGCSTHNRI